LIYNSAEKFWIDIVENKRNLVEATSFFAFFCFFVEAENFVDDFDV